MKKRILQGIMAIFLVGLTANVFAVNIAEGFIGSADAWFTEEEADAPFEVNIFPNPNNGKFQILTNGDGQIKEVVIYNIIGEQVFYQKFGELNLNVDLTHLEKGLYMIQIYNSDEKEKITKRFYIE